MLEGFKIINLVTGYPTLSVTKNGVSINKAAIIKMEYAKKVYLMIDEHNMQIAIQKCDSDDISATKFFTGQKNRTVRWNNSDLLKQIEILMNWKLNEKGYKIYGEYLKEETALIFDLKSAEEIDS